MLRKIRAVKTEAEIDVLRVAARINDRALQAAAAAIAPGGARGTTWCSRIATCWPREGAKPLGERGMLFNSGPDGAFVLDHDFSEAQTFQAGETVVLDAICEYRLYHGDMARTAVVGEPTPRAGPRDAPRGDRRAARGRNGGCGPAPHQRHRRGRCRRAEQYAEVSR